MNGEPRTPNVERPEKDTPMPATYIGVLVFEALIITALFWLGRMFS